MKNLIYPAILAVALVALGIGFSSTNGGTGEKSTLSYDGNLWCVSNYIEQRDPNNKPVYLKDGRPAIDEKLKDKTDWIRKEQVEAGSKEEAEGKATSEYFQPSDAEELRGWLDADDKENFTTHFNTGATSPGPCLGGGSSTSTAGKWLSDGINEDCFEMPTGNTSEIYNSNAYTTEQIDTYLSTHKARSPLNGMGQIFVDAGKKYGVNPGFLLGIANAESSLGLQCQSSGPLNGTKNAFGLTAGGQKKFQRFNSFEEGIFAAAENAVSDKYSKLDGSMREFRLKWCGYETESESSGIVLSNGSVITYDCKNKSSNWEAEVTAVMEALGSSTTSAPATSENATPTDDAPEYCPDEPLKSGPSSGEDYQMKLAKEYEKQMSYTDGVDSNNSSENGSINYSTLPSGILDVPAIDVKIYRGLGNRCGVVAAGMANLYRTGRSVNQQFINWILANKTVSVLANVGTGVVDRRKCASSDNWSEIRHQVVDRKNPVVLATSYGGGSTHYMAVVGFSDDKIYLNDGSGFVGKSTGHRVKAREVAIKDMNRHLVHANDGCRYEYAK